MREILGVLLMEEEDGSVAVQLFASPDKATESFNNLAGRKGQKPQRATFLKIGFVEKKVEMLVKDLPIPELSEKMDAFRLGEGPIKISEENADETKQG